jgi:hypothetical protein
MISRDVVFTNPTSEAIELQFFIGLSFEDEVFSHEDQADHML